MVIQAVICGYGYGAKTIHCPIIAKTEGIQVYGVVSSQEIVINGVKLFKSLQDACDDPVVDVVIVTNASGAHFSTAKYALSAGKHVIVDKPLCLMVEQAQELIQLAQEKQKMITAFHNRRFDGDFLTVKELIHSGKLGKVSWIEVSWNAPMSSKKAWKLAPAEEGGGRFFDLGSHMIDQILQLFPESKLESVYASMKFEFENAPKTDSHAQSILSFDNGVTAVVNTSSTSLFEKPRFLVIGSNGTFSKYGVDPQEAALNSGDIDRASEDPQFYGTLKSVDGEVSRIPTINGRWRDFYDNFVLAFSRQEKLSIDPYSVQRTIAVIESSLESAKQNTLLRITI